MSDISFYRNLRFRPRLIKFRTLLANSCWPAHYGRNEINKLHLQTLSVWKCEQIPARKLEELGFTKSDKTTKVYHDWGLGSEDNERWTIKQPTEIRLHSIGAPAQTLPQLTHTLMGTEIIVDGKGNHVTDEPWNAGSYNYAVPKKFKGQLLHFLLDMIPYFLFANSPRDPSWLHQRIWRTIEVFDRKK